MPRRTTGPRATIVDVARAAGVSRQTVSNAMNNPEKLAPETLARVLAAVEAADYRPSVAARNLRRRRAQAFGLEINAAGEDRVGGIGHRFLAELTRAAREEGCHIVPFVTDDREHPESVYEEFIRSQTVDAFILTDVRHGDTRPDWLTRRGVAYVSFGRNWDDPSFTDWVDVDGAAGVEAAVDHLVAQGYRRVAFLGWPEGTTVGDDRYDGWARATRRHGIFDPDLVGRCAQDFDDAGRVAADLIRRLEPGDAVACLSDVLALGVSRTVVLLGLRSGVDIGVVGFDDSQIAEIVDLTSLRQPLPRAAAALVRQVHALANGEPVPTEGVLLTPELVVRESSSPGRLPASIDPPAPIDPPAGG